MGRKSSWLSRENSPTPVECPDVGSNALNAKVSAQIPVLFCLDGNPFLSCIVKQLLQAMGHYDNKQFLAAGRSPFYEIRRPACPPVAPVSAAYMRCGGCSGKQEWLMRTKRWFRACVSAVASSCRSAST